MSLATFLCGKCDGYGATTDCNHHPNDPACDCEVMCVACDESGVVRMDRDAGFDKGLQPWSGDLGRSAARVRAKHVDPLIRLAEVRACITRGRTVAYHQARQRAMKPVLLPPDFAVSSETAAHFNAIAERDARAALQNHQFVMGHFNRLLGKAA
jgi:hypothetical protein